MTTLVSRRLPAAFLTATLFAAGSAHAAPEHYPKWPVDLEKEVSAVYHSGFRGTVHLFVKDLTTGVRFTHNAATPTYLASVVKLFFMIELYAQVEAGEIKLDETYKYRARDVRGGSPLFNYLPIGTELPLEVVAEAMIQQSDNAASDIIANRVGIKRINQRLRKHGYTNFGPITTLIDVRHRVFRRLDSRADNLPADVIRSLDFARGLEARTARMNQVLGEIPGTITVPDMEKAYLDYYRAGANSAPMEMIGDALEKLVTGKWVSKKASNEMLDLMLGTQTGEKRMASYLPADARIAHKTGTQFRRTCDVGIMYLPGDKPVVFAACLSGSLGSKREAVIARLAGKTYNLLVPEHLATARKKRKGKRRRRRRKSN